MSAEKKTLSYGLKDAFDRCVREARPGGDPVCFGSRIIYKDGEYYQERLRNAQTVAEHLRAEGYQARVIEGTDTTDLPEGCGLDEVYDISVVAGPKLQTPEARAMRVASAVPEAARKLHGTCVQAAFRAGQDKRQGRRIEVFATTAEATDRESESYVVALAAAEAVADRFRTEEKLRVEVVEGEDQPSARAQRTHHATYHVRLDISF